MIKERNKSEAIGNTHSEKARRSPHFVHIALLVLGTIAVVYALYGIIERTWLTEIDMDLLHMLHVLRGVGTSVLVAALVSLYLIRSGPSLFPRETGMVPEVMDTHAWREERLIRYARWFIQMRWVAAVTAGLLTWLTVKVFALLEEVVFIPLLISVLCLVMMNLVFLLLVRRRWLLPRLIQIQVYADLVILYILLHFSGGIENPLSLLALFHVIIGGILLSRRECYLVAGFAGGLFCLLAWAEWSGVIKHYTLLIFPHSFGEDEHAAYEPLHVFSRMALQCVVLFLIAHFITTITARLRVEEQHAIKMTQQALTQRRMLERIVEAAGAGLLLLDQNLEMIWFNEQLGAWLNLSNSNNTPGENTDRFRAWIAATSPSVQDTLADGQTRITERVVSGPGSEKRHLQIITAPVRGDDSAITQVVQLVQDITVQKHAQEQLVRAGKMAAIGELAGNVAHEINNPIAIISAKARLLLSDHREGLPEKVVTDLGRIVHLSDRVGRITQGLLSYYRPSPGPKKPMDIRVPLYKALDLVQHLTKGNDIKVEAHLDETPPPVRANGNEMEQVFLNLLINAIDAMPNGGNLSVSTSVEKAQTSSHKKDVTVTVKDTGTGISPEIQRRIFEPFFTTKEVGRGTGLGLSICAGLISNHNGQIEVHSDRGGTQFIVKLPIATISREDLNHD